MGDYNKTITVQCESVDIDSLDSDLVSVRLKNINLYDIVGEFDAGEVLSCLDYGRILEFIEDQSEDSELEED